MDMPYAEVIGQPIAQSKSPLIHRFWLEKLGLAGDYLATEVKPDDLGTLIAERRKDANWRGCNVTMPHKLRILDWVDALDPIAEVIGSANCITRSETGLLATNTDTNGVVEALGAIGLLRRNVVVLGTGGAARTVLAVMKTQGLDQVGIIARDPDKAASLAARFGMHLSDPFDVDSGGGTADLLVNTTPLGMTGFDEMPVSLLNYVDLLQPGALVFDMVYAPLETRLLSRARANGLVAISGLEMLLGQAEAAFRLFFGTPAPREHDEALRVLLSE